MLCKIIINKSETIGIRTVNTPISLYPSLCVIPHTANKVITAPQCGRELC